MDQETNSGRMKEFGEGDSVLRVSVKVDLNVLQPADEDSPVDASVPARIADTWGKPGLTR